MVGDSFDNFDRFIVVMILAAQGLIMLNVEPDYPGAWALMVILAYIAAALFLGRYILTSYGPVLGVGADG